MPVIRLLATGGTIASVSDGSGYRASVGGADLLASSAVSEVCPVSVTDADTVGSFAWQWADMTALLRLATILAEDVDGIVVTRVLGRGCAAGAGQPAQAGTDGSGRCRSAQG